MDQKLFQDINIPIFDNSFNIPNNFAKLNELGSSRERYKENSLSVLENSDLVLPAIEIGWREQITDVDFSKSDSIFFNLFPGEHYRLIKAITKIIDPKIAIEIGTLYRNGYSCYFSGIK